MVTQLEFINKFNYHEPVLVSERRNVFTSKFIYIRSRKDTRNIFRFINKKTEAAVLKNKVYGINIETSCKTLY